MRNAPFYTSLYILLAIESVDNNNDQPEAKSQSKVQAQVKS